MGTWQPETIETKKQEPSYAGQIFNCKLLKTNKMKKLKKLSLLKWKI